MLLPPHDVTQANPSAHSALLAHAKSPAGTVNPPSGRLAEHELASLFTMHAVLSTVGRRVLDDGQAGLPAGAAPGVPAIGTIIGGGITMSSAEVLL